MSLKGNKTKNLFKITNVTASIRNTALIMIIRIQSAYSCVPFCIVVQLPVMYNVNIDVLHKLDFKLFLCNVFMVASATYRNNRYL